MPQYSLFHFLTFDIDDVGIVAGHPVFLFVETNAGTMLTVKLNVVSLLTFWRLIYGSCVLVQPTNYTVMNISCSIYSKIRKKTQLYYGGKIELLYCVKLLSHKTYSSIYYETKKNVRKENVQIE